MKDDATEEKTDTSNALDASSVIIESNGTESKEQDTSSRSGNDAHVDDADIRPIYNEEPMAEVQTTAEINIFATGQQHTEQPEFNNEGEVDQNAEQCHDIRPLPAKLTDNRTTELSNQLLESENVCLKKTVAQCQKDFAKLEAHCINLELQMENNVLKSGQQSKFLKEKSNEAKVKNDIDVTETINIELEHSVAKLLAENEQLHKEKEHLKHTYKDLFDSIKRMRVQTKDQNDSLMAQLNNKSNENVDVLAQIQKKGFAIAALKNELRKLTGNSVNTKFAKPSILGKPIPTGHRFSIKRTSTVHEKTTSPRSCLRWQPTGRILKTVCLRWVPTGKIFTSSTTKVDSEPPNGSKEDITNQCESEQALDVSAGTLLSTGTSFNPIKEGLRQFKPRSSMAMMSDYNSSDLAPQRQEMSIENVSSGLDTDHAGCLDYSDHNEQLWRDYSYLGDKLVSGCQRKKNCTAMSSAAEDRAEYMALSCQVVCSSMWMRTQLQVYGFKYNTISCVLRLSVANSHITYKPAAAIKDKARSKYLGITYKGNSVNRDPTLKLLRSLLSKWKTHALIWRNKVEIETISLDDLYNNLKIYEPELTGSSSTSQNSQNVAFVSNSTNNTNSTNKIDNTTHGVSITHTQGNGVKSTSLYNLCDVVIYAFLTSQTNSPQLAQEDLEQLHPDDLEEIDLQWEMAMLTIRARRFIKRTWRKLDINGQRVSFDKSKVECYNGHKHGHFARECRFPRNQENKGRNNNSRIVPIESPTQNALIAQDGIGGYDWSYQAEEEQPTNHALMAFTSSGSSSISDSKSLNNILESQVIDKFKTGLGYDAATAASPALESFVNLTAKSGSDKGYQYVPPPLSGNFIPRKPDLTFIDEIVESENLDVTTVVTPCNDKTVENKGVSNTVESNVVRMNNTSAPIIEDWNSDDESEIDYTIRPSTEKIKSVKTVKEIDAPKKQTPS
ncbi:hypothetical protein Tco_1237017 [Tanacetum coccineum]